MSLQRAYVNCKRCYELVTNNIQHDRDNLEDDMLYNARNEAMKALEQAIDNKTASAVTMSQTLKAVSVGDAAERALTLCMECDYSRPSLVDFVDKLRKSPQGETR